MSGSSTQVQATSAASTPLDSSAPTTTEASTTSNSDTVSTPVSTTATTSDGIIVSVAGDSTATTKTHFTTGSSASSISSSTATQIPLNHNSTSTHGISSGEAAGIGIGSAIAGAILAFLLFWIFMNRSNRSKHGKHRRSRDIDLEKPLPRSEIVLDENLLERADDSQIRKSMLELNELIDQHVENYYDLKGFNGSQGALELRLGECGFGTALSTSAGEISSILKNPKTRFAGIRHVIASVIVKNIGFNAGADVSLLSPKIAAFCQSMPPVERQPGSDEVFEKAFTKWRQMTAFLLSPTRSSRDAPQASQRELQNAINRNITLINGALKPFIKTGEMQRYQEENLKAILFQGAQLGLLLFCQPSTFVFGWNTSSREDHNVGGKDGVKFATKDLSGARAWVVFPGIAEKIDRHGRQKIREVVAPVAVNL